MCIADIQPDQILKWLRRWKLKCVTSISFPWCLCCKEFQWSPTSLDFSALQNKYQNLKILFLEKVAICCPRGHLVVTPSWILNRKVAFLSGYERESQNISIVKYKIFSVQLQLKQNLSPFPPPVPEPKLHLSPRLE